MILALTIALLIGSAVYLIQQRGLVHIVLGMMAFGHGANLTLLATGVYSYRGESFPSQVAHDQMADPLPQAFVHRRGHFHGDLHDLANHGGYGRQ